MPKSGTDRAAKYAAKFDPTVIGARATAMQSIAIANATVHQNAMGDLAGQIRTLLNAGAIPPIHSIIYISFGNKLYGIVNKFGSAGVSAVAVAQATTALKTAADNAGNAVGVSTSSFASKMTVLTGIWNNFPTLGVPPSPLPS